MSPFAQPSTLDPKLDVVFSLLFGAEQNRHLLSAFINDVVRPPTPFTSVDVLPPRGEHLPVDSERMFPGLRLRLPTGEQVELELQTRPHPALRDRLLLNFSRVYISQLPPGSPPSLFKRCVCILLTNFKELRAAPFTPSSSFEKQPRASSSTTTWRSTPWSSPKSKARSTKARSRARLAGANFSPPRRT